MIFQQVMIQSGAIKASQSPRCLFLIVQQRRYLHIKQCDVNVLLSEFMGSDVFHQQQQQQKQLLSALNSD